MEIIFESVPQGVFDEIPASFLDITFNHLRTVEFYRRGWNAAYQGFIGKVSSIGENGNQASSNGN